MMGLTHGFSLFSIYYYYYYYYYYCYYYYYYCCCWDVISCRLLE